MRLIKDVIDTAMRTDDNQFKKRDSKRMVDNYNKLTSEAKEIVDDMFISFTGYSFTTIIDLAKDEEEYNEGE